jgi:hypothetical protein
MSQDVRRSLTVGQIAQRLNEPLHRVEYAIKSRGIKPVTIGGNARIFDEQHVERIAAALLEMDSRRDRLTSRKASGQEVDQ